MCLSVERTSQAFELRSRPKAVGKITQTRRIFIIFSNYIPTVLISKFTPISLRLFGEDVILSNQKYLYTMSRVIVLKKRSDYPEQMAILFCLILKNINYKGVDHLASAATTQNIIL